MGKREEQKEKRREDILFAGLELFVKNGYSATKTSDIAKAVHMSDGLLFHYFPTKEALYEALIRIGMERSGAWFRDAPGGPVAFFNEAAGQVLSMIREDPRSAKFFVLMSQALRSGTTPGQIRGLLEEQGARYVKTVAQVRAGQRSGEIRSGDPEALSWAFWCSVQGIAEQLAAYPETPLPKAEWIVGILKKEA